MLIIDSHLDLSWNALQWDRDLLKSVQSTRQIKAPLLGKGRGIGTVALPEMRQGRIFISVATLLSRCTGHQSPGIDYGSVSQAHAAAKGQLDTIADLQKMAPLLQVRGYAAPDIDKIMHGNWLRFFNNVLK